MWKNWLLTAVRNFRKNAGSFAINIFGLTVGLSACLVIALYIRHELSYDSFQQKGPRVARVLMEYRFNAGEEFQRIAVTSTKVAPLFKRTFPEVEASVRMADFDRVVSYKDKLFRETHFYFADSSSLDVFSFPLIEGDPHTALSGPGKVILTRSAARRYFGPEDPVGKVLRVGADSVIYQVTGLMDDCPSNSQMKFEFLASFSSLYANQEETYYEANYTTFLLLKPGTSMAALDAKVRAFMKKDVPDGSINLWLEPFMRIHLYSEFPGFEPGTSILYIYILAGVALLILLIACSTYINLSTARSIERAREVGVRKVIGAGKGQLFRQFIGESLLLCLIAVVLSLAVVLAVLPAFNRLADRDLPWWGVFSPAFLSLALGVAMVVGLLAGAYPAMIMAGFQPVKVLKGSFKNTRSGRGLRQSLIVFQFIISVFLIVSTFVMQEQLSYIRHKNLGYNREHVLALPMSTRMLPRIEYVKTALRQGSPDVLSLSYCRASPVEIHGGYSMRSQTMPADQSLAVNGVPIDQDYIRTMGLQLVAGEGLTLQDIWDANPEYAPAGSAGAFGGSGGQGGQSGNGGSGTRGGGTKGAKTSGEPERYYHFILNESAARQAGWSPQEAIGKRMWMGEGRPGIVKGVVKDFHFQSLHQAIRPLVLMPEMRAGSLLVKVSGEHLPQTIAMLEGRWKQMIPYLPFEYRFLDDDYNRIYRSELRLGQVMDLFSGIAIILACLGLFGLSSYAAKQRVKEIGIRKVLGASLTDLVVILSAAFVRMAAVAILIAFPLAWWATRQWLQDFIYRVEIPVWIYILAGALVLMITLVTVSIQAVKTALLNPVKNLKVE